MGVGIRYTGTDGRTTSFTAMSPLQAMKRLSSIGGYAPNGADAISAGLAQGWRARHKERARSAIAKPGMVGQIAGQKFASPAGLVSELPSVAGVSVRDGNIVETSQKRFVSDGGRTVGVGAKVERVVGRIPANEKVDVEKALAPTKAEVGNLNDRVAAIEAEGRKKDAPDGDKGEEIDVVTGIYFDTSSGPLVITVAKRTAKVVSLGDERKLSKTVGAKVSIHESMENDVHALAYVLSRREISGSEAKAYAPNGSTQFDNPNAVSGGEG